MTAPSYQSLSHRLDTLISATKKTPVPKNVEQKMVHYADPKLSLTLSDLYELRHLAAALRIDSDWLITGNGNDPFKNNTSFQEFLSRLNKTKKPAVKRVTDTQHVQAVAAMASARN